MKLVQSLKAWRIRPDKNCGLLFPTAGCQPKLDFLDCLKAAAKRVKLKPENFWLHKFRATFATWSLWAGVDLRTVQEWLGHLDLIAANPLEVGYGVLRPVALLLTSLALVVPNTADEAHHHDALTDQQLGTVHFPVSCAPGIQKDFERGVALLHSFAFDTAEQAFRQVLEKDPRCAMAHWGIAKSKWRWDTDARRRQQGVEEVKAGERLRPPTRRECDYLKALGKFYAHPEDEKYKRVEAFNRAMKELVRKNPEDHEAQAFYAWSLIFADDESHANRKKAAAILERLFVEEPNHPGVAHYLIHTYDFPGMAEMGLPAARHRHRSTAHPAHAIPHLCAARTVAGGH